MKQLLQTSLAIVLLSATAFAGKSSPNTSTQPVTGRIAFISESKITLKVSGGEKTMFNITPETKILLNGAAATPKQLKFDWKVEVAPAAADPANAATITCNKAAAAAPAATP